MLPALEILYENDDFLVMNKPAGLSTQAPRTIDSLELRVRAYLQQIVNADMKFWQSDPSGEAPAVYLGLPHRLDRPVSGAIVLAKTKKAARKISLQFERRTVRKVYWALIGGDVEPGAGTWTDFMRKIPDEAQAEIVIEGHSDAQRATLDYRTLCSTPYGSLLEIELGTGRMHQIRLQAASRGMPIVGDILYNSTVPFGPQFPDPRLQSIALHARKLAFIPLGSQEPMEFVAPLPEAWKDLGIEG